MDQERRAPFGKMQSPRESLDALQRVRLADSPARGADLYESMQEALHSAARAMRSAERNGEPDERSQQALDVVCELARREELRAEQLLILLKDAWRRLPEVQSVARMDADVTLACVITHCIKAFYRPSRRS